MLRLEEERRNTAKQAESKSNRTIPLYRVLEHDYEIREMKEKIKASEYLKQLRQQQLEHSPSHNISRKKRVRTLTDSREGYHELVRKKLHFQARQ